MSKQWSCVLFLSIVAAGAAAPISAAEESITSKQADEILAELRELRKLIETKPGMQPQAEAPIKGAGQPARTARVDVGNAPFLGSKDAPLTIVEYTDFQCPFCRRFFVETLLDLKKNYIDSGKVRFYSIDLPLDIHRNALQAAQAGQCASDQGQFWAMHDRMQENPDHQELADLNAYAQEFHMNADAFRECLESGKHKEDIQREAREATRKGARGTPAFVIGKSTSFGVDGQLIIGADPYDAFDQRLRELLRQTGEQ
jgi:protein-disulfide isomerase